MRLRHFLFLIASLTLIPKELYADEQLQFVRIGYSPIQNVGEKIIKEVYRRAGVGITVMERPAKRAAYEAAKGQSDGEIMRIKAYQETGSPLHRLPYAVGYVKTQVYVRNSHSQIRIEDLSSHSIAVVRGVRHTNIYVKDFPHVLQVDDVAKAVELLSKGRVRAAIVSQFNGEYEIKAQNLSNILPLSEPVIVQGIYHYINRKHPHIINKIESTLKAMHDSGELEALWSHYASEELNVSTTSQME